MANPRHLYKFRHFEDDGRHLSILSKDEIFFPSPGRFNDPFDCRIPLRYDDGTRDEVVGHWLEYLDTERTELSPVQRKLVAEDIFDSGRFQTLDGIKMAKLVSEEFAQKRMGVFSLSTNAANILMWSHYSHSHTGFSVGFLTQDIRNMCLTISKTTNQLMVLLPVSYNSQYPDLNAYRISNLDRMKGQLLSKASDWTYEGEYRILLQNGADNLVRIPYDLVRRVILGCQVTNSNRQKLIDVLRSRRDKPVLYQAVKADRSFSLCFKRIVY